MKIKGLKSTLKNYSTVPSKGLGQNFLVDRGALNNLLEAAELKKGDVVVEIGPGTGILTKELLEKAKKVIAFEKDKRMCALLQDSLGKFKNLKIIQGDILTAAFKLPKNYKVVANIPYYITSPIIRKFLESENKPELMILMVQKEVGQRICAKPPNMSILSVSVQFYAKARIVRYVSRGSFWPSPKVDSAIIKINPLINADKKQINADIFFKIVKAGFSHPRKQLLNNFSKGLNLSREKIEKILKELDINPQQRAETLSTEKWIELSYNFYKD